MILHIILCSLQFNCVDRIMFWENLNIRGPKSVHWLLVLHKCLFVFSYIPLWICFYFLKRATFLCVFVLALFVVTFDARGFPFLPVLHKRITYIFIKSSLYSIKKKACSTFHILVTNSTSNFWLVVYSHQICYQIYLPGVQSLQTCASGPDGRVTSSYSASPPIPLPLPQETSVLIARITFPGKVGRVIPGRKQQAAFEGLSVIHRFTVSAVGWRWGWGSLGQ